MKTTHLFAGVLSVIVVSLIAPPDQAPAQSLWVESSGVMILPDRVAGTTVSIDRTGVRNEFVTAQLGLRSTTASTQPLTLTWGALTRAGGTLIARSNITLFRAADIVVDHGDIVNPTTDFYRARKLGSYPDALVPVELPDGTNVANSISLAANTTLSFWVDIFIPPATAPGDYAGSIVLKSGTTTVSTIPVTVHVVNVTIPAETTFESLFNLRAFTHVTANVDNYVTEIRKHRIQPSSYHLLDYGWAYADHYNPGGAGNTMLYFYVDNNTSAAGLQAVVDAIKAAQPHLLQTGLAAHTYIHLTDEPSSTILPKLITLSQMIQQQVPYYANRIMDTATLDPPAPYFDYVSYQVRALKEYGPWYIQTPPMTPTAGRPEWDQYRAQGKHLWFYVSNAQGTPFPTYDIHTYNLAWEPRVLPWAYWYEKAEGHLYWDLFNAPSWQLDPGFPPGDGQLIYPGDFSLPGAPTWTQIKDIKRPVISRRLKVQREGLEEYELLKMAEAKVGRSQVQAIVDTVYKSMGVKTWAPAPTYDPKNPMWSYDETKWDAARTQLINILNTSTSPPPPPPPPPPPANTGGKFTIVTQTSGVQAIQGGFAAGDVVSGLHLVDLNADNKLDLYLSMHGQGASVAALNDGKGVFTKATGTGFPLSEIRLPYDITEDGKADVAFVYQDGGAQWWRNLSAQTIPGGLLFSAGTVTRPANTARQNVLVDINKDGKVDWLRGAAPGVAFDFGDGQGNFASASRTLTTGSADDTSIFPIDLDNSGTISLIVQWGGGAIPNGKTRICRNDGAMNFTDVTTAAGLSADLAVKGIGDFNHDGFIDLLVLENNRTTWSVYLNDGHGHFVKKPNAVSGVSGAAPANASSGLAAYVDFDNDGLGDLLVSYPGRLLILRGTGGGNFTYMNNAWAMADQSRGVLDDGLCFGDIDADGMLDIVAYNGSLTASPTHVDVYHNGLTKKNWINIRPVGLPGNKGAAGAKIRVAVPGGPQLWYEQVALIGKQGSTNYYNFAQTERHFGLGARTKVDVSVEFYPSGRKIEQKNVSGNTTVTITETP